MGITGEIFWNGRSSTDLYVVVENAPDIPVPTRKIDVISVPGRNGDIIIAQDAFENVTQDYSIAIVGSKDSLPTNARAVVEWLMQPSGYARLEDSFNPDVYRMAYFSSAKSFANGLNTHGRATIQFSCKPQRYLRIGERPILATSGMKLTNPSAYPAKPLIIIKGSGSATMTVGSFSFSVSSIGTEIDIDCETQNAYYGSTNKNSELSVTNGKFPELKAGDTQISWTGSGVTSVTIIPRWWIL